MRILFVGLFLASLVSLGMFAFSGFGSRDDATPVAPAAQGPAASARPADPKQPAASETVTAAIETVRAWLPGGAPDQAGDAGSGGGTVYYQWTDARGSVHIVQSLEEVPAEWRDRVGRIEMQSQPKPKRAARQPPRRARPASRAPAYAAHKEVVVYSATWCGWCRKTLAWLDARGIDYENRDIDANPANREELIRKAGRASIPVVEIDGRLVRGFDPSGMQALLGS